MPFIAEIDDAVSPDRPHGDLSDNTRRDENCGATANEGQATLRPTGDGTPGIDVEGNAAVPRIVVQVGDSSAPEASAASAVSNGGEMRDIDQPNEDQLGDADSEEDFDDYQRAALALQAMRVFLRLGNLSPHVIEGVGPLGNPNIAGPAEDIRSGNRRGFSNWQGDLSRGSTLVNCEVEWGWTDDAPSMDGDRAPGVNSGLDFGIGVDVPLNSPSTGSIEPDEETCEMFHGLETVLEREIENEEIGTYGYEDRQSQDDEDLGQALGGLELNYSGDAYDGAGGQPGVSSSAQVQDGNWHQQAGNAESSPDRIEAHNTPGSHGFQQPVGEHQVPNNVGGYHDDGYNENQTTERRLRDWNHLQGESTDVLFGDNELLHVNNSENLVHSDGISHPSNDHSPITDNMEGNAPQDIPIRPGSLFHLRPSQDDDVFGIVTEQESTSDVQPAELEQQHDNAALDEGELDSLPEAGGVPVDGQTREGDDGTRSSNTTANEQDEQETQPDNHPTGEDEIEPDGNMHVNGWRSVPRNRVRVSNNLLHTGASSSLAHLAPGDPSRTFTGRPIADENGYVTQPFNAPGEIYVDPADWDDDHDRRVNHAFETYRTYTDPRTRVRHRDADKENVAPIMAPPPINTRVGSPNRYEHHEGSSREHRPFSFGPLRPVPSFTSPLRNINTQGRMTNAHRWYRHLGRGIGNIPEERTIVTDTVRPADEPDVQFERRR